MMSDECVTATNEISDYPSSPVCQSASATTWEKSKSADENLNTSSLWGKVSTRLLKRNSWSRLGSLGTSLTELPQDIAAVYDHLEKETGIVVADEVRLAYFKDFSRAALGGATLHIKRVEELVYKRMPDVTTLLGSKELNTLMRAKLEHDISDSSDTKEFFDFDEFAELICDIMKLKQEYDRAHGEKWFLSEFINQFPIDPESNPKQLWDLLCMLILLYCSFSVPFGIAFPDSARADEYSIQDNVDMVFNVIFMLDIGLSFLTAFDHQACPA
jgi:hypothetical protein